MTTEHAKIVESTRAQVLALLGEKQAHMTFNEAVADFPAEHYNTKPPHVPYTPWHLLEHLRIAQRDILDFVQSDHYREQSWPSDYWPAPDATADTKAWDRTIAGFQEDLAAMQALVADPTRDLHAQLANADDDHYTLLREALLVADHNAYHIGEFAILRQVMGTWPPDHDKA